MRYSKPDGGTLFHKTERTWKLQCPHGKSNPSTHQHPGRLSGATLKCGLWAGAQPAQFRHHFPELARQTLLLPPRPPSSTQFLLLKNTFYSAKNNFYHQFCLQGRSYFLLPPLFPFLPAVHSLSLIQKSCTQFIFFFIKNYCR